MGIGLSFQYNQFFDDDVPRVEDLLRHIPSRMVMVMLATANEMLCTKGDHPAVQQFLLETFTANLPKDQEKVIRERGMSGIYSGYRLFSIQHTVEFINRELINYREVHTGKIYKSELGYYTLNVFKAYLVIMDEMNTRNTIDQMMLIEEAKKGGYNLIRLMWMHMIRQFEFAHRPNPVLEAYKSMALISYLERHDKFGPVIKPYFKTLQCENGQDYLGWLLEILMPHQMTRSVNPNRHYCRMFLKEPDPTLEILVIDPATVAHDPDKQLDYIGLKERPLTKYKDGSYVISCFDYVHNALFNGLVRSVYEHSGVKSLFEDGTDTKEGAAGGGFGRFRDTIEKELSEAILFKNIMVRCFTRKYDCLKFFDDHEPFNPGCYYRHNNHIFLFEFKDHLLNGSVIHTDSFDRIKAGLDELLVRQRTEVNGEEKPAGKDVSGLAKNIVLLANDGHLFYSVDELAGNKQLQLRDMIIHPVIIHTNVYLEIPGFREYLDDILQERLASVKGYFKRIDSFKLVHLKYFFERILFFANSRLELHEEFEYVNDLIRKQQLKSQNTLELDDWFDVYTPFSSIYSRKVRELPVYSSDELGAAIIDCWQIETE